MGRPATYIQTFPDGTERVFIPIFQRPYALSRGCLDSNDPHVALALGGFTKGGMVQKTRLPTRTGPGDMAIQ
jgi:hypothetical protein